MASSRGATTDCWSPPSGRRSAGRSWRADYGIGSIAEVFEGNPPFSPGGCIAQAWSVAETLRAWSELTAAEGTGLSRRGAGAAAAEPSSALF
jgi:amylo-alpha-1,6-glucosidase